ncbi:protein AATF [Patella vulgata]|uniref:protein AATF n=1 Tax=Patella vulgata TaxID=6465 RepID=UPI00217F97A6|nr:protein AATF [Patella vulgata]
MASLSEKLAKLADTTPVFHDPEQDTLDLTVAKLAEKDEKDDSLNISTRSSLRTKSTALLDEDDSKYSGKRTSRKKLRNDEFSDEEIDSLALDALREAIDSDDSGQSVDDDEEEEDDDDEIDIDSGDDKEAVENFKTKIQQAKKEFSFEGDGDYGKYGEEGDEEEDDDDEGDDDDDEEMSDEEDDDDVQEEKKINKDGKESGIKQFSTPAAASEEVEKGKHAKNQLGIWDGLLETRIKLQKTVSSINQLPQPSIWSLFNKLGGENFDNLATEAQCELRTLLEKLVQLQTLLLLQNPATKQIVSDKNQQQQHTREEDDDGDEDDIKMSIEDDEEITSEEEDGQANKSASKKPTPLLVTGTKRKIPLDEYPEFLAKRHTDFQTYRNDTITKWNSKTQLVSGKIKGKGFGAFNQSVLKQIQQIMSDKERLIRRTQLKRSDYRVLGTTEENRPEEQELPPEDVEMDRPVAAPVNDYDVEIFDDSDFYHHMLREFIDRKSSEIDDPLALGRQWLEVQKSRTKVKRHVDTKASKGRKLRYNVHSKLINFMAPVDNSPWTDEARDDLYKSLFGQKVKLPEGSDESSKGR